MDSLNTVDALENLDAANTLREALLSSPPNSPTLLSQPGISSSESFEKLKSEKDSLHHEDVEAQAIDYDAEDTETAEILNALKKTYNERYAPPASNEALHYTSLSSHDAGVESVDDPFFYKPSSSIKETFEVRVYQGRCGTRRSEHSNLLCQLYCHARLLSSPQKTCPSLLTFGGTGRLIGTTALFVVLFWVIFEVRIALIRLPRN